MKSQQSRSNEVLLDQGQLCVVEVLGHISDYTGNDGSGDTEPFLPAAAPRPVLNAFEERGLGDVLEQVGHGYQGGSG